jgi:hypothetical protein
MLSGCQGGLCVFIKSLNELILTSVEGIEFESCYASRIPAVIDGIRVDFIDLENLKKNKRAASRAQDLADLEKLE